MTKVSYEDFLNKKNYYTQQEFLDEFGSNYRVYTKNTLLIKNEELFDEYKNADVISFRTQRENSSVSQKLIIDLLTDEALYQYLLNHMVDDQGLVLRMSLIKDGKIDDSIKVTRATLAKAVNELIKSIPVKIPSKVQMRMALITNMSAVHSLNQNFQDQKHQSIVDGELIEIPSLDLYDLLNLSDPEYSQFINEEKEVEFLIDGEKKIYSKRVVCYMIIDFIESQRILEKYLIPDVALDRYIALYSGNIVDYESINKNEKSNDVYINGTSISDLIKLDQQFESLVLQDMNPTYSLLEESLYIYYKLCELLSYNQERYASNNNTEGIDKIIDIDHISKINIADNEVTGEEFIAIYSYFLKHLGIKYTINGVLQDKNNEEHSKISFKVGEYLVSLDPSIEVLQSDMASAKINDDLKGIYSTNKNATTRIKFSEMLCKIAQEFYENKQNKVRFSANVRAYEEKYANTKLSKKEKVYMLFKEIGNTKLKGIDVVDVHKRLFDRLFKDEDDVEINFISSAINAYKDYNYTPLTILSIKIADDDYVYYQIDPNNPLLVETVSAKEITDLFESRDYAYIGPQDKPIPGIKLESRGKYVR